MKKILYVSLIALTLSACLKDEGNYDYADVSHVTEINGIDESYNIYKFEDVLTINPEITFENGIDESNYTYKWNLQYSKFIEEEGESKIYSIIISEDKNLEFTADHEIPGKELFGSFEVTNKITGVVFKKPFTLRVQNAYEYGYFFLCEKGNDAELFLIRENNSTIPDLHTLLTGDVVAGKPLQMENVRSGIDKNLVIFTNAAPNYGSVIDFLKLEYKGPATNCFHEGIVETPFTLNAFVAADDIYTVINNKYYYTNGMISGDYKPYISVDIPDVEEPISSVHVPDDAFLHAVSGNIWMPSGWGVINKMTSGGSDVNIPGQCVYIGSQHGGSKYDEIGLFLNMFTLNGSEVTETVFNAKINWTTWETEYTITDQRTFIAPDLINDDSRFVSSYSERYYFFSSGNKIYRYNYDAPGDMPVLLAELPAGQNISYLYLDYYRNEGSWTQYDEKFVVATYDNSGEMNGSVYYIDMEGKTIEKYEHVCGKIVDLVVKE